jgi:hypothetical protein
MKAAMKIKFIEFIDNKCVSNVEGYFANGGVIYWDKRTIGKFYVPNSNIKNMQFEDAD